MKIFQTIFTDRYRHKNFANKLQMKYTKSNIKYQNKFINSSDFIMKLRRTLPSVTEYSANKNNNQNNDSINIFDRSPFARSRQTQNQNNLIPILNNSQSPRKPIFQSRNSSQFRYSLSKNSQKSGRKTVTFVDQVNEDKKVNKQSQTNINVNRNSKIVQREYRRKSIFDKKNQSKKLSSNNNNSLKIVEAQINLKQFSDQLKMQHQVQAISEQKIFSKISQLENKVNQLHNKAVIKNEIRFQQVDNLQKYEINNKNVMKFQNLKDNNVLKLQLEQVRRCERIAKQNEVLYGALTKNLQQKTQVIQSRIRSTSFQHLQHHTNTNYDRHQKQNKSKQTKIVAFQDFEYFQLKNRVRDYDEIQGNMQLVSPFLLQQNKGKIKLF